MNQKEKTFLNELNKNIGDYLIDLENTKLLRKDNGFFVKKNFLDVLHIFFKTFLISYFIISPIIILINYFI